MRQRWAFVLTFLLMTAPASALMSGSNSQTGEPTDADHDPVPPISPPTIHSVSHPWIESSLSERVESGSDRIRVTVITRSLATLNQWQYDHGAIEQQKPANPGEKLTAIDPIDGEIDHRTFWMDSAIFPKLVGVRGLIAVLDAQNSPEPYDITPFQNPPGIEPDSVRSGEIHGAIDAWELSLIHI